MKAVAVLLVAGAWFYFVWDIVKDGEREKEQHIDIMKGYPYETTPVWRNYKTKDWPWECKECTLFDMDCQKACKARLRQEKLAKKAAAQEAKKGASAANGSDSQ